MTETSTYGRATETIREVADTNERLAGLFFVALSAQFMTAIMLAAAMAPGYDFGRAAISDLGVIDETALLFNASLLVVGLFNVVGGFFFYRVHGERWIAATFALAGFGAVGAAVFPLDTSGLHGLFALVAFLFFNVQALATATRLSGAMRAMAILAGGLGLVFVVLMALGDSGNAAAFGPIGHGGTERMIVYPVMLWLVAFGGYLLANPEDEALRPDDDSADLSD